MPELTDTTADVALAAVAPTPAVAGPTDEGVVAKKGWGIGFWICVGWIVLLAVVFLLTPWLPLPDRNKPSADLFASPSMDHLFGTDNLGRDMFARVIWGGRISCAIGTCSLVLGFLIGGFLGLTAGFFRGRYERLTMGAMDVMLAFPSLILALALIALLSEPGTQQGSFGKIVTVLTILAIPALARITRANTLVYSQREFVTAARSLGAKPKRILLREILPNVLPAMISFSFIALAILVLAEGALAFLGVSVEAPAATWGKLIVGGREHLDKAPWIAMVPCGALFVTLLALNFVGDRLQSRFSVREGQI